ncbi:MAG TPA: sigma-70 family RNA polymerase sigma factor, partial [Solirubrobacterales bacterium]|nr:sigma-70 family RNA polymerase sigma factor [Solirubrobacterales bacterium]
MPPPAEGFAARLVLGPALRTQPDRRLVALVRDGYETAFDEIVRRYGGPLRRYAAAIVGGRSEDVTQDAFSKALLALRRDDAEIELRPWLYRIVRNTALNDLRARPPAAEALAETLAGGRDPAEELERREELAELIRRLRTLPESQRAAIVMRELEGLGHEEIATVLGLSGGGARQAIHRARTTLRDGLGMLLPMPALKALLAGSSSPSIEAAAGAAGAGGAGVVLKAATATVLVVGAIGAGTAIDHGRRHEEPTTAGVARLRSGDRLRTVRADSQAEPSHESTTASPAQDTSDGSPGGRRSAGAQLDPIEQGHGPGSRGGSQEPAPAPGDVPHGGSRAAGPSPGNDNGGNDPTSQNSDQGSDGSSGSGEGSGGDGAESDSSGSGDGSVTSTSDDSSSGDSPESNSSPDSGD